MLNRQAFPKSPSNMPRLQRELVDVPDCVRFGIPWQWPAIADIRSWPFTRRFFRFEAVSFLEVGNFFGEKGRSLRFGWQVQVDNRYGYVRYFDFYSSAGRSRWFLNVRHSFQRYPKLFSNSFQLVKSDGWANTTGLILIQIFLFEDQWHLPVTQKTVVDDWANLGRIWKTWKTFPKHFFYLRHTLIILMEIHISLYMY